MSLCRKSRARSAETRNQGAPAFGQRCGNRNGQAIGGEFSTSSTVIGAFEGNLPKPDRSSATDTALVCACGIQLIPISQYPCGVAERTRCSLRGGVDW